jgi:hypothetical protein
VGDHGGAVFLSSTVISRGQLSRKRHFLVALQCPGRPTHEGSNLPQRICAVMRLVARLASLVTFFVHSVRETSTFSCGIADPFFDDGGIFIFIDADVGLEITKLNATSCTGRNRGTVWFSEGGSSIVLDLRFMNILVCTGYYSIGRQAVSAACIQISTIVRSHI